MGVAKGSQKGHDPTQIFEVLLLTLNNFVASTSCVPLQQLIANLPYAYTVVCHACLIDSLPSMVTSQGS